MQTSLPIQTTISELKVTKALDLYSEDIYALKQNMIKGKNLQPFLSSPYTSLISSIHYNTYLLMTDPYLPQIVTLQ